MYGKNQRRQEMNTKRLREISISHPALYKRTIDLLAKQNTECYSADDELDLQAHLEVSNLVMVMSRINHPDEDEVNAQLQAFLDYVSERLKDFNPPPKRAPIDTNKGTRLIDALIRRSNI